MPRDRNLTGTTRFDSPNAIYNLTGPSAARPKSSYELADADAANAATANTFKGAGTPEGAVVAPVGSTYHRTNGGASTSFYVKETGTGNTGWVAK